jgi:hypothetical protein
MMIKGFASPRAMKPLNVEMPTIEIPLSFKKWRLETV